MTATPLPARVKQTRACQDRGWAVGDQAREPEVACAGPAIADATGSPVTALNVSGPAYRMRPHVTGIGVRCGAVGAVSAADAVSAAGAVSAALGAPGKGDHS